MASTITQPAGAASGAASYVNVERIGFGLLMIGAPLVVLAACLIHPPHAAENGAEYYHAALNHSTAFYISHTLFFFGAVFLLPAVVGLARLLQHSHPKAAFWGGLLSLMGFVGWGALDGMDFMTYVAGSSSNLDTSTMQTFVDDALANTANVAPVTVVFLLLIAGLCVIAVGLHRAGILPLWLGLFMPIGIFGVISTLEYPPLLIGSALLLLASFGTVGVRQLRALNGTRSEAAPI
jgi:hypothetical protein